MLYAFEYVGRDSRCNVSKHLRIGDVNELDFARTIVMTTFGRLLRHREVEIGGIELDSDV